MSGVRAMLWGMETITMTETNRDLVRVARSRGSLEGTHTDYYAGNYEELDLYIGVEWESIEVSKHPERFVEYSVKEMKGFQEYWHYWSALYGKDDHAKITKPGWGLMNLTLHAFASNIEIGEPLKLAHEVETGYTPTANRIDIGELVWITPKHAVADWHLHNQDTLAKFALTKRTEAIALFEANLKKLS